MKQKPKAARPTITEKDREVALRNLIYLCACVANEKKPDAERVRKMDLRVLYLVAGRHLLSALTAYALEAAGIKDPAFTQLKAKAMRKCGLMDAEMRTVFAQLEQAGIWYVPLKGSVLKEYYPEYGMRQMADCDVLFDKSRAEDVKTIFLNQGYEPRGFLGGGVHDAYQKEPVCNVEMHRALFGEMSDKKLWEYYQDVEKRLIPDEGKKYGRHFSTEDFYVYVTAHAYKHYSNCGTGIRFLLDAYLFLKKEKPDWNYVEAETQKLGIADFERESRSLALHLFGGGELTEDDRRMLDYVLESGTYGTLQHHVSNELKKRGCGKLRYAWWRFCMPLDKKSGYYKMFEKKYPIFYKHKALLPFLPVWRLICVIKKRGLSPVLREIQAIKKA